MRSKATAIEREGEKMSKTPEMYDLRFKHGKIPKEWG